jgi:glycosyltransferase involved in cell wall biosynthesis
VRIAHINKEENIGGASRSAYRLHKGLLNLAHESTMFVYNSSTGDRTSKRYVPAQDRLSFHQRNLRRWYLDRGIHRYDRTSAIDRTFFADDRTPYTDVGGQIPPSDIINLHWVAEFLDYGAFFEWLPESMPLVWTLHDMAPFTGGCCYDMDCGKFTQSCGACPQLGSKNKRDFSRSVWKRKAKYYQSLSGGKFHIVSPSRWLGEQVKRSSLLSRFPLSVIPYALDLEIFCPRDRLTARGLLQIPQDAKVLLFVSQEIFSARKGFHLLVKALEGMEQKTIFLLSLGVGRPAEIQRFPHVHIPSANHDGLLSLIYSAADVFVLPSLADNLPNTMLESIACGTPVVGFAAGGIPETVRPGVTGLLAKTGDISELRAAILELIGNDAKRLEMSVQCRQVALSEYPLDLQAKRYIALYESMLKSTASTAAIMRVS